MTRTFWRRAVFVLVPVTVAAIAIPIVIAKNDDDPAIGLVEAYLEALQKGDVELAATYIDEASTIAGVFTVSRDANGDLKVTTPDVSLWLPYADLGTFDVNGFRV